MNFQFIKTVSNKIISHEESTICHSFIHSTNTYFMNQWYGNKFVFTKLTTLLKVLIYFHKGLRIHENFVP